MPKPYHADLRQFIQEHKPTALLSKGSLCPGPFSLGGRYTSRSLGKDLDFLALCPEFTGTSRHLQYGHVEVYVVTSIAEYLRDSRKQYMFEAQCAQAHDELGLEQQHWCEDFVRRMKRHAKEFQGETLQKPPSSGLQMAENVDES